MSYTVFILSDHVTLPRAKFEACLKDIFTFHRTVNPGIECPGGVASFVAETLEEKLIEAMAFFGWRPLLFDEGICGLALETPRAGAVELLRAIAGHVDSDSIIEYIGEDGIATKHIFRENSVKSYTGRIHYDEL